MIIISEKENCRIEISNLLWGSFVEQMGRAIYGGIYDPQNAVSNEHGYREDVKNIVSALNLPLIRYPGGNAVSGMDWKDTVGKSRPTRLNLAWKQLEPNIIGLHEFYDWCKSVGSELMMAINLGTGTIKDALELVEYCNFGGHSTLADKRRENGREDPFNIKYWCLGNEMDGIWQICNLPSLEYARKAREASKLMKIIDPTIKTTLVGSSAPYLPTYPEWEKTVLNEAYEFVDYISLHRYYGTTSDGKIESFIGQYKDLERYINTVSEIVKETKERKKSNHEVYLALDEWNIWEMIGDSSDEVWQVSSKKVENVYNFKDAVLLTNMIITMAKNSESLKIGCLAQLVNVIAPIMTENGGRIFLQPTYYPFEFASNHLKGDLVEFSYKSPTITSGEETYEMLNVIAARKNTETALLIVNNSINEDCQAEFKLSKAVKEINTCKILEAKAEEVNSFDNPNNVIPKEYTAKVNNGLLTINSPAFSIIMIICS